MKHFAQSIIREGHLRFLSGPLPERIAVCFHELETGQIPAFTRAMAHFAELGYQSCNPRQFAADLGPRKRLFVSFDDNFANWHANLGAIEATGVTATFYTNSAPFRDIADRAAVSAYFDHLRYFGERRTLSRPELRAIAEAGHTIGCHTHTHPVMARVPRRNWDAEIAQSRARLEDIIGRRVVDFSFPYGMRRHLSQGLVDYCASIGFETVATAIACQHHALRIDPLRLHRTTWKFELSLADNLARLKVDGRLYAELFGRSAVG